MEVASPLTAFPHGQGKKRPFGFSPSPVHAADAEMGEQSCASEAVVAACGSAPPSAKRRRRLSTDRAAADSAANGSPFGALPAFGVHAGSSSAYGASRTHAPSTHKRSRIDALHEVNSNLDPSSIWSHHQQQQEKGKVEELERLLEHKSEEEERLTAEKDAAVALVDALRSDNIRLESENRILKKAVAIQQERQSQAAAELDGAHKYRDEAEERMRRLEHMCETLRYHLQAQQPSHGNDFMGGFNNNSRPPDVF